MPTQPGSPEWWVTRLSLKLAARQDRYTQLTNYATGDHPLPEAADPKWAERARQFARRSRTNYCGLAASAVRERLTPVGLRSGADGSKQLDSLLWSWWQANHLDADSDLVHDAAVTLSDGYVIVGSDGKRPLITPEDPRQVIMEVSSLDRRTPLAALKQWTDEVTAQQRAVLYLPNSIHYYATAKGQWLAVDPSFSSPSLDHVDVNPLGKVPVVRFVNRPGFTGEGMAEFEDAIDVQERINHLSLNLLQIAEAQAFRQRYVKGLPDKDENGDDIPPPFEALVHSLWTVEDVDVEFGEFQQVDLGPLLKAMETSVQAFVTLTGLPPHYVAGDLVNASADALAAAEARLVAKVKARQRTFGEAWEQAIRLAGEWHQVDVPQDIELVWADPERKTTAQLADAALKASQFGVPFRTRMADYGKTPQEIDRMEAERASDALHEAQRAAAATAAIMGGADEGAGDSAEQGVEAE